MYENKNIRIVTDNTISAIPELQFRAEAINYEALGVEDLEMGEMFTKPLDTIINIFNNSLYSLKGISFGFSSREEYKMMQDIKLIKEKVRYNNIESVNIPVMIGLNTDLLTTANTLLANKEHLTHNVYEILIRIDKYISDILSNKDIRTSRKTFKIDRLLATVTSDLYNAINLIVSDNVSTDRKKVSELIPNLNSLSAINNKLDDVANSVNGKILKLNITLMSNIVGNIDILHKEFINDTKYGDIEQKRLIELSYLIEEGAKMVTYHASVIHILKQSRLTFKHLIDVIKK